MTSHDPRPRCVNRRHDHTVRQGASCDRPLPPPPFVHRAIGHVTVGALVATTAVLVAGWKAAEVAVTDARLLVELARTVRIRRIR